MRSESLCPDPSMWRVRWVAVEGEKIVLNLRPVRTMVPCPLCGVCSQRVHSQYQRKALVSISVRPWICPGSVGRCS